MTDSCENHITVQDDNGNPIRIDFLEIKKINLLFQVLNKKLQQDLMGLLTENGELTVIDIMIQLNLELMVANRNLEILQRAGLVNTRIDGNSTYYSINLKKLFAIQHSMLQMFS